MTGLLHVAEVLGCAAVGGFLGFWAGILTCPSGSMSNDAVFDGVVGIAGGATVGVVAGILIFT